MSDKAPNIASATRDKRRSRARRRRPGGSPV